MGEKEKRLAAQQRAVDANAAEVFRNPAGREFINNLLWYTGFFAEHPSKDNDERNIHFGMRRVGEHIFGCLGREGLVITMPPKKEEAKEKPKIIKP